MCPHRGAGTAASGPPRRASHPGPVRPAFGGQPHEDSERLEQRLAHAVSRFVDGPRDAVADADQVLEDIAARCTEALTRRRRTLRTSWQTADAGDGGPAAGTGTAAPADTEQLRLALRDYREPAQRLLHL
ncbi:hypothetical protein JS756_12040 [Streptomyces actuosus]|uniref:Uncharacterized protein n=1 Tax=Streptomyces actuosus TaxID=1885 RepID=A0ABS2VP08_STRAS|nr:hypothetical protein [Streptomyces actuosus]